MSIAYSRKLDEPRLVEHFLKTVLIADDIKKSDITRLTKVEKKLSTLNMERSTHTDKTKWKAPYNSISKRSALRFKIINELYHNKRLKDDDSILLGKGGSRPPKGIKSNREAFIVIGLPAAGKSGISNKIADLKGAYILDNDYAKRKIPEFHNSDIGASLTHNEADLLVFGLDSVRNFTSFIPLFFQCVQQGHNIVIPKIGSRPDNVLEITELLKKHCGYKVHLVLVNLNRQHATKRALHRYKETDRYVPLSLIFDGYANDPTLTYFRLKEQAGVFTSFGEIDTTVRPYNKIGNANSIIHKIKF